MKKLLGIVVLGLMLSGCETTSPTVNINQNKYSSDGNSFIGRNGDTLRKGMSKIEFCERELPGFLGGGCRQHSVYFKNSLEIHYYDGKRYAVFKDVKTPIRGGINTSIKSWDHWGDGKFVALVYSMSEAQNVINKLQSSQTTEKPKKPKEEKPKISPDDNKIVPAGSGSGFFVSSNGTVITNYHVIEGCKLNKVSHKGSQYEAKVLAVDKVNDIAILKTNITPDRVFSVSNEDVSLLEDVVVAGYPLGKQISSAIKTHKGVVTALAGAGDNYSYFQTDAAINQGNSGGPILDQKGNVVGIAVQTWVEEGVQGVHFGIKSSTLKTFANANGLKFLPANNRDLSNKDLGKLIMQSTVYVECHMTIASIKKMIAEAENKKAFFKEYQ